MDTIVTHVVELIETEVDGEIVAVDVERGECFGFNATASRVWALSREPVAVSTLLVRLGEEFDVEPAECATDVETLLTTMRDQGLIRIDPANQIR